MTSLPPFALTGRSLGRLKFWRGKLHPNPEIPLGLESRWAGIQTSYLELNLDFGKALKISLKVVLRIQVSGAAHREIWPIFHSAAQNFAQF